MAFRLLSVILMTAALSGCFIGDESAGEWSTPDQIRQAASRCGIDDFEPTRAGAQWAAYVDETMPDSQAKEDCIYTDLTAQGLRTTR